MKANDIFSNPLLLLIAGGILSGILIPYITTQWQNHQKELEIKTDLVGRISQTFSSMLVTREFLEVEQPNISNDTLNDFKNEYKGWQKETSIIGSELNAYFPSSQINRDWDLLVNVTHKFIALAPLIYPESIKPYVDKLKDLIPESSLNGTFVNDLSKENYHRYFIGSNKIQQYILDEKNKIIQEIINSNIPI